VQQRGGSSAVDALTWLRWGAAVLAADIIAHYALTTISNDWEGWGVFFEGFIFILVTGVVIVSLTFGLLVRWALKSSSPMGNRPAAGALVAGIASVLAYGIYFTWAPALIVPAVYLLSREALRAAPERGGRRTALAGAALGGLSASLWIYIMSFAAITGDFPFGL